MTVVPNPGNVAIVDSAPLRYLWSHAHGLPVVVEATTTTLADSLVAWIRRERSWIEEALGQQGAILLRGFSIRTPTEFERVAQAVSPTLLRDYLGTAPRNRLTEYVHSASELPSHYPIPAHCEMSFLPNAPKRLFFHCNVEPTGRGGETPIVDMRAVYRGIDPSVRSEFEAKQVTSTRIYSGPRSRKSVDLWNVKRWDEMFQTTDRAIVETHATKEGLACEWLAGDRLRLTCTRPAVHHDEASGEPVWFNHVLVLHVDAAASEYAQVAARQRELRYFGLGLVARALAAVKHRLYSPDDQTMHMTFGDGTPIDSAVLEHVRDVTWQNMVFFRWHAGDVMILDNQKVAHARMPYRGPRFISVCWA